MNMKKINCLFLRNCTIEPLEDSLIEYLKKFNIDIKPFFSDYDNIVQASLDENFIKKKKIDVIVVLLWVPNFSDILANQLQSSTGKKVNEEIKRHKEFVQIVSNNLKKIKLPVIWTSSILPNDSVYGFFDYKFKLSYENIQNILNEDIKKIIMDKNNFYFFDLSKSENKIGTQNFYDERLWYSIKSPFSYEGFGEIAKNLGEIFNGIYSKRAKCLVLDCDNVLWGGIVGENGLANIKIRNPNGDSEYLDFQKEVLNLYNSGIILSICSKNNLKDVEDVFKKRKDMLLKLDYFTVVKANWNNKADNIIEISKELNIGLDSMVFVDDSKFEINLIKKFIPEVKTIHLDINESEKNRQKLLDSKFFTTSNLTNEDKLRNKMYKAEIKRTKLKEKIVNINDYLKSLDLQIIVRNPNKDDLKRVEQMTQRTNQFNLTTKRLNEFDVQSLNKSKNHFIYLLEARDKFGYYGICGLSVINYQNNSASIEIFLMSCRVIGRGIENLFLSEILKKVSVIQKKIVKFTAKYLPTKKNNQVENFYEDNGFSIKSVKNNKKEYIIKKMDLKKIKQTNHITLKKRFS